MLVWMRTEQAFELMEMPLFDDDDDDDGQRRRQVRK